MCVSTEYKYMYVCAIRTFACVCIHIKAYITLFLYCLTCICDNFGTYKHTVESISTTTYGDHLSFQDLLVVNTDWFHCMSLEQEMMLALCTTTIGLVVLYFM